MLDKLLKTLSDVFSKEQTAINHPCYLWHVEDKLLYATILAATITADKKVEKQQAILFGLLINAMGLNRKKHREAFILAENISPNDIEHFCEKVSEEKLRLHFLTDVLMLFRVDNPLTPEQITILDAWANLLKINTEEVNKCIFVVRKCLLIGESNYSDHPNRSKHWFELDSSDSLSNDLLSNNKSNKYKGIHLSDRELNDNFFYWAQKIEAMNKYESY